MMSSPGGTNVPITEQAPLAAIDLGSNSFHLLIARPAEGELRVLEALSEKVQLGTGLEQSHLLDDQAQERALDCLRRFAQRIAGIPPQRVRIVGTNTLRVAHNARQFIRRASEILGHEVEVIAGREEARLIWLGVSHSTPASEGRRLVVDIGGGSTEFIIGENFDALGTESLHMGCVSWTERFFPDGVLTPGRFERAVLAARQEVLSIESAYRVLGWHEAVGASGTIRAVAQVCDAHGWCRDGVSREGLENIRERLLAFGRVGDVTLSGLPADRRGIFPAGVAILLGVFRQLGLEQMSVSPGALREGVLYDMLGRSADEDVRERTVRAMMRRHRVDTAQADRVAGLARELLRATAAAWELDDPEYARLLRWSALLHEIGFSVSHTRFHRHGAYLILNGDMAGFSRDEQQALAFLVRCHRRSIALAQLDDFEPATRTAMLRLCLLLRLACRLHHARSVEPLPALAVTARADGIELGFPHGWLDEHPLTRADLEQESDCFRAAGYRLDWREDVSPTTFPAAIPGH